MAQTIQIKRGLEANRTGITPALGELIWTTDTKNLYVGDGTTAGGIKVTANVEASYIASTEKGAANGVATLDSNSQIPTSQLPAIAITSTFVVASETAQLALTAQEGDIAVRSDLNQSYVHNGGVAGTIADWTKLLTPTDTILSVNGKTGTVVLTTDDISEGTSNLYYTSTRAQSDANTAITGRIDDTASSTSNLYSSSKIETELGNTRTGAGLNSNGSYTADSASNYITTATSLYNADQLLDAQIKTVANSLANYSTSFAGLTDTPTNYTGSAGYTVKVNATADALEFVDTSVIDGGTF